MNLGARMAAWSGGGEEPVPYPLANWIMSSDWHSSILIHTMSKEVRLGFRIKWTSSGSVRASALIGSIYAGKTMQYLPLYNASSGGILDYPYGGYRTRPAFAAAGEHEDILLGGVLSRDGSTLVYASGDMESGSDIYLLSKALNNSVFYGEKVSEIDIFEDEVLVAENVAVVANGQGAMYDKRNKVLHENAYSGGTLAYELKT